MSAIGVVLEPSNTRFAWSLRFSLCCSSSIEELRTAGGSQLKLYVTLCSNRSLATDLIQFVNRQEMRIQNELIWSRSWFIKTKQKALNSTRDANVYL